MTSGRIFRSISIFLVMLAVAPNLETVARASENSKEVDGESGSNSTRLYPIVIQHPPTLGKVTTGLRDAAGRAIGVECATCHAAADGPALTALADSPKDFHGGIQMAHGNLPCSSCHSRIDRTRLRLASGETIEMNDVIRLCGQCHSSQLRSYEHMAHGGARGYWDRTKGPTLRNSCVSCHAAHAPAYPLVNPAPPPNDRFLAPPHGSSAAEPGSTSLFQSPSPSDPATHGKADAIDQQKAQQKAEADTSHD